MFHRLDPGRYSPLFCFPNAMPKEEPGGSIRKTGRYEKERKKEIYSSGNGGAPERKVASFPTCNLPPFPCPNRLSSHRLLIPAHLTPNKHSQSFTILSNPLIITSSSHSQYAPQAPSSQTAASFGSPASGPPTGRDAAASGYGRTCHWPLYRRGSFGGGR